MSFRLTEQEYAELLSQRRRGRERLTRSVDFLVPGLRTVSEMNSREHWAERNRRKKAQQLEVLLALNTNLRGRMVELPCIVRLTRIGPRRLDGDNLQGSFKGIRDVIARRLGVDDGDTEKIRFEYSQAPIHVREYGVKITINTSPEATSPHWRDNNDDDTGGTEKCRTNTTN